MLTPVCASMLLASTVLITEIHADVIQVSSTSINASAVIPESFVSYSIEFSSFPDFAGNTSAPNTFSDNLLNNLGLLQGTKPYIRVGGNTQDYALYNSSLQYAINGTVNATRSPDYPTTIFIGPSYFESYSTWPGTRFIHGFNLGLAITQAGWETLLDTVPLICKALGGGKLLWWEYGNEPDLFSTSAQGPVRANPWTEELYVAQWLNGTTAIKLQLQKSCPDLVSNKSYGYLAPSFAGTGNHLKPVKAWTSGLDADGDVKLFSSHNYIGGATQPGVTLQGTLMNHSSTVRSISSQLAVLNQLTYTKVPFILGETNSLYNQGKPGLSNSFGAALWVLDFNLWCASQNISRVHMHQGTNYRYQSWQPITTDLVSIGTKPPYYGNVAVAAFLGNSAQGSVQVQNLPLGDEREAAYALYEGGELKRVLVVNLRQYNYTVNGTSDIVNPVQRPVQKYEFQVPKNALPVAGIQRLLANGSDAITGVTWDGFSFNYELAEGRPVRQLNVTGGELAIIKEGVVTVEVPDSSAAIVRFD